MSNAFGWDMPAGAAEDPSAPYNQPSYDGCSACDGEGCDECNGTGEVRPLTRDEIAIEKADRAMDDAKDEPREQV